jgi:hypothetical protein
MREVAPGDLIFSFMNTRILAIGIAQSYCWESPKPLEFGNSGQNREEIGWRVNVNFTELNNKVRPKDHIDILRPDCSRFLLRCRQKLWWLSIGEWPAPRTWQRSERPVIIAKGRKTTDRRWSRVASTRDLPTIAFFRAGVLLRRSVPVPGILATHRPGRLWISLGASFTGWWPLLSRSGAAILTNAKSRLDGRRSSENLLLAMKASAKCVY